MGVNAGFSGGEGGIDSRFRRKVQDDGPVWPDAVILASGYLAFMYAPVPWAG